MKKTITENRYFFASAAVVLLLLSVIQFFYLTEFLRVDLNMAFLDASISFIVFLFVALIIQFPIRFTSAVNQSIVILLFSSIVIAIVSTAIWYFALIFSAKSISTQYEEFLLSSFSFRILFAFLVVLFLIAVNYASIFYIKFKEKTSSEIKLNNLVAESELKSLKYQINPHFIFNALNSISSLTLISPERAQEMTINLSNFLRKTLASNDVKLIKINEEIENLKLYLEIEKVRFDDRLEFNFHVDKELENEFIPNMILQPLVENTIKHGVHESSEKISVNVICKVIGNNLEITVANNYDSNSVSKKGEGVGLANINRRLKLLYKKNDLIFISKKDNIFTVRILIPLKGL